MSGEFKGFDPNSLSLVDCDQLKSLHEKYADDPEKRSHVLLALHKRGYVAREGGFTIEEHHDELLARYFSGESVG